MISFYCFYFIAKIEGGAIINEVPNIGNDNVINVPIMFPDTKSTLFFIYNCPTLNFSNKIEAIKTYHFYFIN